MPQDASRYDPLPGPACPICKEPTADQYKPFCSKRCADIDLGRWFNESYAIPEREGDDEAEAEASTPTSGADE